MSVVQLDIDEGIATVTLNRPEVLNAFTDEMEAGLVEVFDRTDADDDVRAVILTGAGRGFCAGMDVSDGDAAFVNWRTSATAPEGTTYEVPGESLPMRRDGGGRVVLRVYSSHKPVIAAVNGPATGVGATMLLPCDVRLASQDARFGFVFNRRGVVPESCSSWFLPRVVGMQTALEWVLTGRVFPAAEALEQGLVRSVHAPGDLLDAARALAREIADNTAPVSASLARRMLWRMQEAAHPMTAHQVETLAINLRGISADLQEGFTAFLEKRSPVFPGRVGTDLPDIFRSMPEPAFDPAVLEEYHGEA
ncbi:crotonase/enoyl-CoA hydratase family protein [Geodermatophilus amargosae]|uniref:crotonase/enoyl-CoA hydratase family protein n=1 Tax=Geodermatophilus amargosae TaxID=1296565 RepID=UPI0034DFDECE